MDTKNFRQVPKQQHVFSLLNTELHIKTHMPCEPLVCFDQVSGNNRYRQWWSVCVCVCVPATVWTAQDYLFLWKITTPLIKCLLVKGIWYQLCPVRFFSEVKKNWKLTYITVGYRMCNCSSIPHIYLGVCRIDFETFTIVSIF